MAGAVFMALVSIPVNYFISYPMYMNFMPEEVILGMYRAIWPGAGDLLQCLCVFNAPFTLVKGLLSGIVVFFLYKPLTPGVPGENSAKGKLYGSDRFSGAGRFFVTGNFFLPARRSAGWICMKRMENFHELKGTFFSGLLYKAILPIIW